MAAVPRPRKPCLQHHKTRHGKFVWYVRKGRGPLIRIKAEYGTPEFDAAYEAALLAAPAPKPQDKPRSALGTVAWLIERYRETSSWSSLSPATQRQRENIFKHVVEKIGSETAAQIDRADIIASRDQRRSTPAQARNFLDALRGLYKWALDAGHVKADPTAGVKNPSRPDTGGFQVWSESEVEQYEAAWPIGTRERVWFDVLIYTGLRRGDAVIFGRQHVRNGTWSLRTEKRKKKAVTVANPMLPVLEATLAAGPCGELAFICGGHGKPLTKETFGNYFREACDAAGLKGRSAHGLRKVAATRCAENGATVPQLMALFGWLTPQMAAHYTKDADRRKLARSAGALMQRTPDEQSMLLPSGAGVLPEKFGSDSK